MPKAWAELERGPRRRHGPAESRDGRSLPQWAAALSAATVTVTVRITVTVTAGDRASGITVTPTVTGRP